MSSNECLYRNRLQGSEQTQTVFAMYNQELSRDRVAPSYQKLRRVVDNKKVIRQEHEISKPRMKDLKQEYWSRVKKERRQWRKKVGESFQWKANG